MITFFLVVIVAGRVFFKTAEDFNKDPAWLYAVLGIISYYAGAIIGAVVLVVVIEAFIPRGVGSIGEIVLGLMGIPIGILSVFLTHYFLKKSWSKATELANNTLDGSLIENKVEEKKVEATKVEVNTNFQPPKSDQPSDATRYNQNER